MEGRDETGRFVPGHPGGPGRPPGGISLLTILKHKLEEVDPIDQKRVADKLIDRYISDALENGDAQSIRDMIDRTDGKPTQTVMQTVHDDNPVHALIRELVYGSAEPDTEKISEGE
jgi:hypothetical protein